MSLSTVGRIYNRAALPRSRPNSKAPGRLLQAGAALLLALLAVLVLAGHASADTFTPESGGSPNADETDTLFKFILYIAVFVFVVVEGALIYSIVRFRGTRGKPAAQVYGNTRLEIGWTLAAALILVAIATVTFVKLDSIRQPPGGGLQGPQSLEQLQKQGGIEVTAAKQPPPPGQRLEIGVSGQQYLWRFNYPNGTYSFFEMVVPIDTVVTLDITSQDVAHSWWIPKLGGKFDAVPGYINHTWFKAEKVGSFDGQCAELCGDGHANMLARVKVLTQADWQLWVRHQKVLIEQATRELQAQQQALDPLKQAASAGGAPGA